jgi:N-acyl-D-amino-acid deacylase
MALLPRFIALLTILLVAAGCTLIRRADDAAAAAPDAFDLIIRNGRVVDGTGAPWYRADVGIRGDEIVVIGDLSTAFAVDSIDAAGHIVAPGFIDLLGHSENSARVDGRLEGKIRQGVTTELTGEGTIAAPLSAEMARERNVPWQTMGEFMNHLEQNGIALNFAFLVTTSNPRMMTIGPINRQPTPEEMARMEQIVDQAMREGAWGLSTALIYVPAVFAPTEEIIRLARVAARHGGVYFSHIRNEADHIDAALEEAFRIGWETPIPVNIWHLKIGGQHNWGRMPEIIARIEAERARGLDVAASVYPYTASRTGLTALAPTWALEGGYAAFQARLADPEQRKRIAEEIPASGFYQRIAGAEGVLITDIPAPQYQHLARQRLSEIAGQMGLDPIEALLEIYQTSRNSPGAIYFSMHEDDMRHALSRWWVSVGADSGAVPPEFRQTGAHPRAYGTFPRVVGRFVRDEPLFPLEEAVRKVTSLAAARAGFLDRGMLRSGMKADVVVFDPDRLIDHSTYEDPHQFSEGILHVVVNGVAVLRDERMTGALPGRVLRKNRAR